MNSVTVDLIYEIFRTRCSKEEYELLMTFFEEPIIKPRVAEFPGSPGRRFHHCYFGGFAQHTLEVIQLSLGAIKAWPLAYSGNGAVHLQDPSASEVWCAIPEFQIIAAAALHDANKLGDVIYPGYVENMLKGRGKNPVPTRSEAEPWKRNPEAHQYAANLPEEHFIQEMLLQNAQDAGLISDGEISLAVVRTFSQPLFNALSEHAKDAIRFHDGMYGPGRRALIGKENPIQIAVHFADMFSSRVKAPKIAAPETE